MKKSIGQEDLFSTKVGKMKKKYSAGANINAKLRKVKHSKLKRFGDSAFKSECPVCGEGILAMRRNDNGKLLKTDQCLWCGQSFLYTDDVEENLFEDYLSNKSW